MTEAHVDRLRDHWWWRPGWQVGTRFYAWHLTWDGYAELHRLVDEYQAALAGVAGLDPIPRRWLHLTMQGVGHIEEVDQDQLATLIDRAREAVSDTGPITVRFDRPVVTPEAIVLTATPADPVGHLRATLRQVTGEVIGSAHGRDAFNPHVSLAYVNTDQPADAVVAAVESVDPEPAEVAVEAVSLIELHRDHRMYQWRVITELPL